MKAVYCFIAFIAFANAIPSADTVVPEVEEIEVAADWKQTVAQEAKDQITSLLQSGKDEGACADLAASTISEVENAVDAQQKILNSLNTGADCHKEGQAGVDAAHNTLEAANSALVDAEKAFSDAENAPVSVPAKPFSSLKEGECGFFFGDSAYTSAKASYTSAKNELEKARGAQKSAQDALATAQEAQKAAQQECLCDVRASFDKAWKAANANNDQNEKAYTKGQHMKCVLEGTAPADCNVGEVPKVTAPQLADDVPEHHCASFGERKAQKTACAKLRDQKLQYLDRQNVKCHAGNAIASFKVNSAGCGGQDMRYQYECVKADYGVDTTTFSKSTSCELGHNKKEHYLDRQDVDCGSGNLISDFDVTSCAGENEKYSLKCIKPDTPLSDVTKHQTGCHLGVNKNMQYLDRLKVNCPTGKALTRFRMTRSGCSSDKVRYNFWCGK